jgi:hypothetical protein
VVLAPVAMAPKNTDPARAAESNLGYLLGVTAAFHAVALLFVGMRMYARVVIVKAFGRDDALMLASTVCTTSVFWLLPNQRFI